MARAVLFRVVVKLAFACLVSLSVVTLSVACSLRQCPAGSTPPDAKPLTLALYASSLSATVAVAYDKVTLVLDTATLLATSACPQFSAHATLNGASMAIGAQGSSPVYLQCSEGGSNQCCQQVYACSQLSFEIENPTYDAGAPQDFDFVVSDSSGSFEIVVHDDTSISLSSEMLHWGDSVAVGATRPVTSIDGPIFFRPDGSVILEATDAHPTSTGFVFSLSAEPAPGDASVEDTDAGNINGVPWCMNSFLAPCGASLRGSVMVSTSPIAKCDFGSCASSVQVPLSFDVVLEPSDSDGGAELDASDDG
jgi:hypothetical protein